jgi:Tol biopolymer transport system component/DNA-binding winged helix-turn-helix (wHTH) protein
MDVRPDPPAPTLHFGGFTLDRVRRGLYRDGERVRLTPKPLETLIVLVENRGRAMDKAALLHAVWGETAVTEDVLVQAVGDIRRALGDDKDDPRFVLTVPREGYRFVAHVDAEPLLPSPPAPLGGARVPARHARRALPAVALVVLAGGVWWSVASRQATPPVAPPLLAAPAVKQLSLGLPTALKPAFSPDGKTLLYVSHEADEPGVLDLYVMPAAGGHSRRITDGADLSGDLPVFTSDGAQVVFCRYRAGQDGSRLPDLWIVPTFGGAPRLLVREASGAGFSPDGGSLAYTKHLPGRRALWLSPTQRIDEHRELAPVGFTPRFSPDGATIAYTTSDPEGGLGTLWRMSPTGENRRALIHDPQQVYGLAWTPDGKDVVFASSRTGPFHLWRVPAAGGAPEPLTAGIGEYNAPAVSPDGRTLVFSHFKALRDLFVATLSEGAEPRALTSEEFHYTPRLSPSGTLVASISRQPDYGWHLYLVDPGTGKREALGERPAHHPCWKGERQIAYLSPVTPAPRSSSDREQVGTPGFTSGVPNETEVWVVDIETRVETRWASLAGSAEWLDVDPSGTRLAAVVRSPEGRQRIVVQDPGTGAQVTLAEGSGYEWLRWRPDGKALAWSGARVSARPESNGLWLGEPGGKPPRQILADGYGPVWTAGGAGLYFSRYLGIGRATGLWLLDLDTGVERSVRPWKRVPYYDVVGPRLIYAPDGGRGASVHAMALTPLTAAQ